ncbi:MAG: sulfotransferase family 2 domain-containing protein [Candidatus Omnitrophica bacterium]|nr:sulfotransferase family 2 domain-containing protein [Candidatus Omnitrophota bacterium]MDD5236333.1 sulfotransferase family 2 domain-containing protein [Candidatus Omnitrophota bacterium]MDD5610420.1 sulfotransferase family 2 domain-containing protein [Candidatus Omnitrophota bacterium]
MKKKDYLYIFLHVPKCAGSTFVKHIKNNFDAEGAINLYPNQPTNYAVGGYEYLKTHLEVKPYLELLDKSIKDKIKIIYGHGVCYGIHEYFDKDCRYATFLRNPIDRVLSNYNMGLYLLDLNKKGAINPVQKLILERYFLDASGAMKPFDEWLNTKPAIANSLVPFLRARKALQIPHNAEVTRVHLEEAKETLDKFYFVGITEHYDIDAAFLYGKIGIKKFCENHNVAKKYYLSKNDSKMRELILAKFPFDTELYEYALKLNRNFKKHKNFYALAWNTKLRRMLSDFCGKTLKDQ